MIGILNSFVHVAMYSYYLYTALFPKKKVPLSVKKCLTILQLVSQSLTKPSVYIYRNMRQDSFLRSAYPSTGPVLPVDHPHRIALISTFVQSTKIGLLRAICTVWLHDDDVLRFLPESVPRTTEEVSIVKLGIDLEY